MSEPGSEEAPSAAVLSAARLLHDGPLDTFIERRKELAAAAKADGDKDASAQIGRLRKPDVAAWAINRTVRSRPEVAAALVGLGARMRAAQAALDVGALQLMRAERDAAVHAFVRAAAEVAGAEGQRLAPAGQEAVRATAIAVLADAGASDAVASALLTKPLAYSGFGEVDLSDAVAVTGSGVVLTALAGGGEGPRDDPVKDESGRSTRDTTREDRAAAVRLERAREAMHAAETEETRARAEAEASSAALELAEEELAEARERYDRALRAAERARTADAEARAAVSSAVRSRKKAEARLR